jgi:hypothetical protein
MLASPKSRSKRLGCQPADRSTSVGVAAKELRDDPPAELIAVPARQDEAKVGVIAEPVDDLGQEQDALALGESDRGEGRIGPVEALAVPAVARPRADSVRMRQLLAERSGPPANRTRGRQSLSAALGKRHVRSLRARTRSLDGRPIRRCGRNCGSHPPRDSDCMLPPM